ncbi:23S rRNA (guanosine(2251)-2'-O)-methyltransferase RlmB [Candidatus Dojkabacteria bacterium]|uniref:23S rRNA (Guanosine(2251)-2'-O)-methyltransferase RlmB n=1 Tax=Candidatus Dojkabacteria bacterium TaxID=2099670 RepID=A0A955L870_9BACT|nr:23S rRNA (guanosine(2251)-2'-O)-methyltransferase RlmB [Candidatus Dojkabacteria bacterium]
MNIEGRNPVIEVLRSDKDVSKLYIQSHLNQDTKINELVKKAKRRGVKIIRKSKKELDRISRTGSHQGVIAIAKHIETKTIEEIISDARINGKPLKFIYIREAFHEYNVGAIIRTAECAGYDAVILPPKLSVTPNIVRASMGASEHIPILSYSLFPLIKDLTTFGIKVVGIERDDSAKEYTKADLTGDVALIVGGEDKPLSKQILDKCDQTIIIPMRGNVNSLNMSVAAGLSMYEVLRQQELHS